MIRLCWSKYIIDKKVNGYYLWERVAPFMYKERLSEAQSLVDFFVKDDINDVAEHIMTKKQSKNLYNNYESNYRSHIKRTLDSVRSKDLSFDYGTFDQFMREFTKIELNKGWKRDQEFPESFLSDIGKVHANLILFDNVYMIMKTLKDYIKFEEFIKKRTLKFDGDKKKINKWSDV